LRFIHEREWELHKIATKEHKETQKKEPRGELNVLLLDSEYKLITIAILVNIEFLN